MKLSSFKFFTSIRVRNYEVDWQGIVHNVNYLLYLEVGRIEYIKNLGIRIDAHSICGDAKFVIVKNEITYRYSARYGQLLKVYTRISRINNSSFIFEGLIVDAVKGFIIAENRAHHVWLNKRNNRPVRVPEHIRKAWKKFEKRSPRETG